MTERPLMLASSSPYRRALLARLELPFQCASPDIDETPQPGENAEQLATRLAESKARALAAHYDNHWIIGSDQVACLPDGTLLNKPGSHQSAVEQLRQSSGQCVQFMTGLALLDTSTSSLQVHCETFSVNFRDLSEAEIEAYLRREEPYDCAGSFRMEGLGITLFKSMAGRDPNSLIGLPLIALIDMLRQWGRNPLLEPTAIQR
ncbi:septum formation inhibitor Maf [Marinobacter salinisoli]|uniref:7-methyl-GTP pyrophosphatase n=1 Tax=Marinobacter salinisoli TaxID=2769486 RepID=A0ABX7MWL1_9GAMM|nr:Maf family nucleotide pyrophosphatase [Marinobacter salinisoli]QSP96529.1 septum formation inhibitor Maf [Marinobacter salinisoli]